MDWSYIAGFFDGEGCISRDGRRKMSARLTIVQTVRQYHDVLSEMKTVLDREGIRSTLESRHRKKNPNPKHSELKSLRITDWRSVSKFLRLVLPYLHVKKEKAEEILRYIETRTWRRSLIPDERYLEAMRFHKDGHTLRDACSRYDLSFGSLKAFAKKHGIKTRSRSEAMVLRHQGIYKSEMIQSNK